jgi:DNA-binding CsgD family transcriptional regulator
MDILETIQNAKDHDVESIIVNTIGNFSCHTYVKDTAGKYIFCNHNQARSLGMEKGEDVIGLSDQALFTFTEADALQKNDHLVAFTRKRHTFLESGTLSDGMIKYATSYKMAVFSPTKRVIGVMGLSIVHDVLFQADLANPYNLSKRQLDCLLYLVKGFTIKEIANYLAISARTIEHYMEAIKHKLQRTRRSDLISIALTIPYIKQRILGDIS